VLVSGCDLFQVREPQPPSQGSSTHEVQSSSASVLRNLKSSIAEYNIDNYITCLVDSSVRPFVFVPSSYYAVFNSWGIESERQYFLNLGAPAAGTPPSLTLTMQDSTVTADSVRYSMSYRLFFPHHRSDVAKTVIGNMQLYLLRESHGLWFIYRWEDSRTTTDSTWSYLKASF